MKLAKAMGIESELPDVPSIALGSSSISLLEMTSAYTTFANEGKPTKPVIVTNVVDAKGNSFVPLQQEVVKQEPVLTERSLKLTREMLRTVVHEGTASRIRWRYGVFNDLAGKTGTTQGNADGWFMAVMPELVVGSWVGADDQRVRFRTTELGQGASTALPITGYFMKQVNSDKNFKWITDAKFPTLPVALQQELTCDLYELDSALMDRIARTTLKRDSLLLADTTATQAETFLEQLYKRKMKLKRASEKRDSVRRRDLIDIEEIENE
jgi:penicillin-binding protein 1A